MDKPSTQLLASQVGGHAGVMTTEDGSLLIKPALHHELAFYQKLQQDAALASLREYTPKFLGVLKLEGQVDPAQTASNSATGVVLEQIEGQKESIVLENLSHTFLKPNILDIKLGTVLYDETASAEKVARMEKAARDTTSFETGVRLTGFQVHDNVTGKAVNTPKSYGKSIKVDQLAEGIAKFFSVGEAVKDPANPPTSTSGLSRETLVPIVETIRDEIKEIRAAYGELEIRMVGGSLLILYEADWERAEEGVKKFLADDGDGDHEEADEEEDADSDTEPGKPPKVSPPIVVKLIDFAHTKLVPGEGQDKGVLLGMDTVLKLLDDRLAELTVGGTRE
ncbi:hypothetical protein CPB83DRAFT_854709 [Crepidotus variabilis]|uniref:Kinase n=1 Tax=Crepidotus variabilis TaxID=179855 RepID=A0A9P6EG27_9AGAR|nr:hypothetical protein CPB83DRAFT_854709 [Crepidotus variabilis]